ncbi:hypothetical protein [Mariniblastus fucicola]|uniref:Transmembrane protein n=2 Tax=Mariniblastus fucicola TaxID=980251 RepID=A0A5B9P5M5_9BACT|nr:hypothetical protein [Mariniblastus fucicola]QEG21877.1 hypothetical protein MFFC18_17380 [Mariniblastus fucicola]
MDEPASELESKNEQRTEAGPLVPSFTDAVPGVIADAHGPFWMAFFSLIVLTLFVPVFPLYMHTGEMMWLVPVWAVYVLGWVVPLLATPIIVLHITICFYVARFTFPYGDHTRSISLLSMMVIVSIVTVFVAMTVRFYDVGFVATFIVFAVSISSANLFADSRLCGVIYPRLSVSVARIIFWLSCIMTVFGLFSIGSRW